MALNVANFQVSGAQVTGVYLQNGGIINGTIDAAGHFILPENSIRLSVNFVVDGTPGSVTILNGANVLMGTAIPGTDTFSIAGNLITDQVAVALNLTGTHTNRRPHADIEPKSTVECNTFNAATITLDGSGSTDPENNIHQYQWSVIGGASLGSSEFVSATLPIGATTVRLAVLDTANAVHVGHQSITVADHTAPALIPPPNILHESCAGSGAFLDAGVATVEDICDPSASLSATIVDINGVMVDIPLTTSGFQFLQGTTTIRYVATDAAGNSTTAYQSISVAEGPSCCPADAEILVGTNGSDSLNGGNKRQCIVGLSGDDNLAGQNQSDILIGGPGNDTCNGGNGTDVIRCGSGDDILIAGNGGELWGGPGNDVITGGNGKNYIRGGAGMDDMTGGNGADVFVIAAACETGPGETIDGGPGVDRLESPLTQQQLAALGVVVTNIEEFVLIPTLADAECLNP